MTLWENRQGKGVILTTLSVDGAEFAEIAVSDNGKGFPREDRHRLIEPYVTTRAEGTGLGLPIVVKIFEDHGGGVELLDGLARERWRPRGKSLDETALAPPGARWRAARK